MNHIDLIAGIPACGKTTFGDYLRDKKGYLHLDMETFQGSWHHRVWDVALRAGDLKFFVELLVREGCPVVLTWGFHPDDLALVTTLKSHGVILWWLDGDEVAARRSFVARGTGHVAAFDAQIKRIKVSWASIHRTFSPRIIQTLDSSNVRLEPSAIWAEMCSKR